MLDFFFAVLLVSPVMPLVRTAIEAYEDNAVWPGRYPRQVCLAAAGLALVYAGGAILAFSRVWA